MAWRSSGWLLGLIGLASGCAAPTEAPGHLPIRGADVSMLIELEQAGAKYFADPAAREPADAVAILKQHGCDWFRLRLFVDPSTDFNATWGATQDLRQVRALSQRVKAAGGKFLLDLHYSDTWADGVKQAKPKAWASLDQAALERVVYDYTRDVLATLAQDGSSPDMVQIGNEIAGGMLYPNGKVQGIPEVDEALQWTQFAALLNAGARAVRDASTERHPIRVMIHIHGGGHPGVPGWFFSRLAKQEVDFDVIGLSFYPAWGDSIDGLTQNLRDLTQLIDKPVVLAEVAYPAAPIGELAKPDLMRWPLTEAGQAQFARDVVDLANASNRIEGVFWWYPEAIPAGDRFLWRDGAEALFTREGKPRPALGVFGRHGR